jgi:tryptophan-rich sensory protein
LNKPSFSPPNYLFAPVWTALYILMGIALYLVWINGYKKHKKAIIVFGIQLGLNLLWSILFFGMRNPLLAFIEILLLWSFIVYTIILFYKTSKTAAYLLTPYILWVSFASVLNFFIFYLN